MFCWIRNIAEVFMFCATGIAAVWALVTYRNSLKLERGKWLKELYEKFYERGELKEVRDILDNQDIRAVFKLVNEEGASFTDYLNFFEFLGYLADTKQIKKKDILDVFEYYLRRLKENPPVVMYIKDSTKGFEKLQRLLDNVQVTPFLFVYGTLMRGFDSVENWRKRVNADFVGYGKIRARLYDLGEYPGAIQISDKKEEFVVGEVYKLRDPEVATKLLDEYEEFFPLNSGKSLFIRTIAIVIMDRDDDRKNAWAYFYNGSVDQQKVIPSGDYRNKVLGYGTDILRGNPQGNATNRAREALC